MWGLQQKITDQLKAQRAVFNHDLINAMRDARSKIDTALTTAQSIEDQAKQEAEKEEAA
jgi:hypothetical protein